jgi:hypothetical protein
LPGGFAGDFQRGRHRKIGKILPEKVSQNPFALSKRLRG